MEAFAVGDPTAEASAVRGPSAKTSVVRDPSAKGSEALDPFEVQGPTAAASEAQNLFREVFELQERLGEACWPQEL